MLKETLFNTVFPFFAILVDFLLSTNFSMKAVPVGMEYNETPMGISRLVYITCTNVVQKLQFYSYLHNLLKIKY